MHIEYLREYIELAQCLNFTEAARRSCITQSALSKHLVSIEKEFGTELVARDRHSVELTQAGHALLQEALAICDGTMPAAASTKRQRFPCSESAGFFKILAFCG